jgi:hypothetical protein
MLRKTIKNIALIFVLLFVVYTFLLSDFNPMFKNERFVYLTSALKETEKEDLKSFVEIYNKIHKTVKERQCMCELATSHIGPNRHGFSLTKMIYTLKIEKEFTKNHCLKFGLLNYDFGYKNIGIKNASKFYFSKTIDALNEDEKITLVAMFENSSLYNPIRNKQFVINKVRLYKRILHQNNDN